MRKPIKILHVLGCMNRGGAEMRTMEMYRHLDRQRYQFHFCALSGSAGEFDDEIRALGGQVHLLRRNLVGFPRRFRRLVRDQQYDAVHSQVYYYSGVILRIAAGCGVPVRLAQFHNTHDGRGNGPLRSCFRGIMRHWIDAYATDIVAVSEGVMAAAWKPRWHSDERCRVVYNGVDTAPFEDVADRSGVRREFGLPADVPLCIHVGRMLPQKNHARLVSMFAELLRRRPEARLLLVGAGGNAIERQLRRQVAELAIENRVVFCGPRGDVPRLLGAADVLWFPSRFEGLPGVVQEACLAGLPVVATELPGVKEIADRLGGVVMLPLAAADARWADAVAQSLAAGRPARLSAEARRSFAASEFTIQRCLHTYGRIWQGRPSPSPVVPDRQVHEEGKAA